MNSDERRKLITEASQAYYSDGTSPLTDAEFDALLEEERKENPNSDLLSIGHGYTVEQDSTPGEKVEHIYGEVGSLPKCHNWKEYPLKDVKIAATLKLDGLSCVLYYRNGHVYRVLTRGNGHIGIDITDKVKKICPEYFEIPDKDFTGAVRGEILMSYNNFNKYLEQHPEAKFPRNTATGLIGMKEVSEDLKYLSIIVYRVIGLESKEVYPFPLYPFSDYYSMHEWLLENFGNRNVVHITKDIYDSEAHFMQAMEFHRKIWYSEYPADGIVITDNSIEFSANGDKTEIIYNASAFKFKAESATTTISGIEWNLSKTKYLVPTILVEPVELSGATVRRCAGCNAKMVKDNGWGVGAKVSMLRSGEVIPVIDKTIEPSPVILPEHCPECGAELVWDGVHLKCPNPDCKDIQIQDLLVWCNNIAPVDGLGDTLKIKFFEEFGIKSIEDIYSQAVIVKRLLTREEEGAQKSLFCQVIDKLTIICDSPNIPIISALKALNIPRLGDATAELLSHYPDDIKKLMQGEIPDNLAYKIGNANSESIIKHAEKFKRLNYISRNLLFEDNSSNNSKIKVAITGSLSVPRKQFEQLLNDNGFILGDITKDTKYLITDNPSSGSSKNAKADKLGIEKITEVDFRSRFNL